jgi:hypothetical protein
MKQKNLSVLTLLASLMLLIFTGFAGAATTVTFLPQTLVHDCTDTLQVRVNAGEPIKCFDMVGQLATATGGAFATIQNIILHVSGMDNGVDLDVDGSSIDKFRFWACDMTAWSDVIPAGATIVADIVVNVGFNLGTFTAAGSTWPQPNGYEGEPGFVNDDCAYTALTITPGTYTVTNTTPDFTNCPSLISKECSDGVIQFDFNAVDPDCGTTLTYSLGPGTGGAINSSNGLWEIDVSEMCGTVTFSVIVTDEHGAQDQCTFDLFVDTDAPTFTACPTASSVTHVLWGYEANGDVNAVDPDGCPQDITYTLCGIAGPGPFPGTFDLNSTNGEWSWQTLEDPAYIGTWDVCINASDGCKSVDCHFDIVVLPTYRVWIEKAHNQYQGHYSYLSVFLSDTTDFIGGYDFLIHYDPSGLTFIEAQLGDDLVACGWEYFTYRYGNVGNCVGPCPSGLLRIIGMAETNNGPNHPDCFGQGPAELAKLKFYVTNDRTFDCMYLPVQFYWFDCGDNGISSVSGDTLWIARHVYWYDDVPYEITGTIPWFGGWQSVSPALNCDVGQPNKPTPLVGIDFWAGGVDVICADSIDLRGDINLNNVANEIADVVLYTNYFIYGLGVFDINIEGQIAASDVNNDGKILTVGDLVYITRILTGDALPFPKLTPYANSVEVNYGSVVKTSSAVDIGAALFVFDGEGTPVLLADGMEMKSDVVNGQLRVLVWSDGTDRISAGENEILSVSDDLNLVEYSFADYNGNMMNVMVEKSLPTEFALRQNFPNPFNPTTHIVINVPAASDWKLDIFNVTGQLVESFSGYTTGGKVEVTWNAMNAASGIYFYKASAGSYTDVKKMVLMK